MCWTQGHDSKTEYRQFPSLDASNTGMGGAVVTEEQMEKMMEGGFEEELELLYEIVGSWTALSGLAGDVMFYLLAESGTEGKMHLLERKNSKSPNSEVEKDFMNL